MGDWQLAEAQQNLSEVIRTAESCGPQRVNGPDGDAFVLSARDYKRFVIGSTFDDEEEAPATEPVSFLEMMQRSPLAEAMRDGDWPWEWDDATRSWVLPNDAIPA
jgi:prevent-host-death family protein